MRRILVALLLAALPAPVAGAQSKEAERLEEAALVLKEILDVPENIPQELLDKAECVGVIPSVKKFAIGIGGSYGRGAFLCRSGESFDGPWGAPAMYRLEGGSIGLQLGGTATDFVLLVMNPRGANAIIKSKVKLGADAAAAAGPKGRTAEASTDATMRAEILTYSRARGLFAGVSLQGSTLRADNDSNRKVYGRAVEAREILREGKVGTPADGKRLVDLLNQHSPKNLSD
jgi:lipid-binding SYLF domain-containing protein